MLLATLEGMDRHQLPQRVGRGSSSEKSCETQGSSVVLEEGVCSPSLLLSTQW